jgi:hypothetical protein
VIKYHPKTLWRAFGKGLKEGSHAVEENQAHKNKQPSKKRAKRYSGRGNQGGNLF